MAEQSLSRSKHEPHQPPFHSGHQAHQQEHRFLQQEQPGQRSKVRRAVRAVFAIEPWKRQIKIVAHRASFPLLRQFLRSELAQSRSMVMLSSIDNQTLMRSKIGHMILMIVMGACCFWSLITLTKGLAAAIRFDVLFNSWLISGVPLAIFTALRLRASYLSYKAIVQELAERAIPSSGAVAAKE